MTIYVTSPLAVSKILTAGKYRTLAVCPGSSISAVVNVRFVSRNLAADSKIRLAIVPSTFLDNSVTAPTDDQWIQPVDLILGPNGIGVGIIEDTGIVLKPNEMLVAYSDNGLVTARSHGFLRTAGV